MKVFDYNFRQFIHIVRIIIRELRGSKLEPEVPFMDRFLSPAANCVHVGASDGRHSLYMARRVPRGRVHCVEASPYTLGVLKWVRLFLGIRNLVLHNLAIGSEDGDMTLVTPIKPNRHRGRAFAFISDRPVAQVSTGSDADFIGFENQPVRVRTLDSFCVEQGIQQIDFLRCDIEGAEILMLDGGEATIARHRPIIMLEVHPIFLAERFGRSADELWQRLTNLDYDMFYLNDERLVKANAFFHEKWRDYFCVPRERIDDLGLASNKDNRP